MYTAKIYIMNTKLFKQLKQQLRENDYYPNGDKWGAAMNLHFENSAFVYEENETPSEWQYKPGAFGNSIDKESCNYEFLNSLTHSERLEVGNFLHRLTNLLERAGLSY